MPTSGGIFKSAAVEVLRRARRLMTTGEICRLALDWGLLTCSGKTPEATMASAMYGDIKRKDRNSLFIRWSACGTFRSIAASHRIHKGRWGFWRGCDYSCLPPPALQAAGGHVWPSRVARASHCPARAAGKQLHSSSIGTNRSACLHHSCQAGQHLQHKPAQHSSAHGWRQQRGLCPASRLGCTSRWDAAFMLLLALALTCRQAGSPRKHGEAVAATTRMKIGTAQSPQTATSTVALMAIKM
jgi:hypothetical protein